MAQQRSGVADGPNSAEADVAAIDDEAQAGKETAELLEPWRVEFKDEPIGRQRDQASPWRAAPGDELRMGIG